jgi:hypothetical protein
MGETCQIEVDTDVKNRKKRGRRWTHLAAGDELKTHKIAAVPGGDAELIPNVVVVAAADSSRRM